MSVHLREVQGIEDVAPEASTDHNATARLLLGVYLPDHLVGAAFLDPQQLCDLASLLVRLEDSFGIAPAADGTGLSLNPKAPHAPKAAMAIELWAEKRAAQERRDRRRRIRGLESLAVAALRISQSMQLNQDSRLGGERRTFLRLLSFYSPLRAKAFPACLGSK